MIAAYKLDERIDKVKSLLCVGLDSDIAALPEKYTHSKTPQFEFNKWIIDQTHEYVLAYKLNMAFYEARGEQGWKELRLTMEYLREHHPDVFTICDAKRGDIGNTNTGYVTAIYDELGFDAVTLHPYLGKEALEPFLARHDKMSIILCKTSNPGSHEFQDLQVMSGPGDECTAISIFNFIWEVVAQHVAYEWNKKGNCMLVVGATYPEQLKKVRAIAGDMTILVPGIGAQGGSLEEVLAVGLNTQKRGLIVSSSRGIIYAQDPRKAAQDLFNQIKESAYGT